MFVVVKYTATTESQTYLHTRSLHYALPIYLSESCRSPSSASHLIVLGAAYASLSEVARRSGHHDARIMPGSEGLERSCRLSAQVEGLQVLAHFEIGRARVGTECVSTCRSRWSPYH